MVRFSRKSRRLLQAFALVALAGPSPGVAAEASRPTGRVSSATANEVAIETLEAVGRPRTGGRTASPKSPGTAGSASSGAPDPAASTRTGRR